MKGSGDQYQGLVVTLHPDMSSRVMDVRMHSENQSPFVVQVTCDRGTGLLLYPAPVHTALSMSVYQ